MKPTFRPTLLRAALTTALLGACGGKTLDHDGRTAGTGGAHMSNRQGPMSGAGGHSSGNPRRDGGVDEAAGGADPGLDAARPFPPGFPAQGRPLSSLGGSEAKAFCMEDARRSDPCILEGMATRDATSCAARVAACHTATAPGAAGAACDSPADLSRCSVTVAEYFDCIDAWNKVFVCANAGFEIPTPPTCQSVAACELSDQGNQAFMQLGAAPPCDPASPPPPPDTDDDIHGLDGCSPRPSRMVVLGNSVAHCDSDNPGCAPLMLADYLRKQYSPSLQYENHASGNSDLVDLLREAKLVQGGPGHVAVWVFAFPSDPTSLALATWKQQLEDVFDYFADASRFPDGATFMLNTQYDPSDQCSIVGPSFAAAPLTPEEEKALQTINENLFIDVATARDDTVTVDEHPDWLGHGSHANVRDCPHCSTDNSSWQADQVHPNEAGYEHIFGKWRVAVDLMYGGSCTR